MIILTYLGYAALAIIALTLCTAGALYLYSMISAKMEVLRYKRLLDADPLLKAYIDAADAAMEDWGKQIEIEYTLKQAIIDCTSKDKESELIAQHAEAKRKADELYDRYYKADLNLTEYCKTIGIRLS